MKRKIKLEELSVKSFVTAFDDPLSRTIQGGANVNGSEVICPKPRTFGCPSVNDVSCLPPRSEGCFSEAPGNCTETIAEGI